MKVGAPKNLKLEDWIKDKTPVWNAIVKKHNLAAIDVQTLALWPYGDYQLRPQWDVSSSMAKARRLGFDGAVNSFQMFRDQFSHYRAHRVIA